MVQVLHLQGRDARIEFFEKSGQLVNGRVRTTQINATK